MHGTKAAHLTQYSTNLSLKFAIGTAAGLLLSSLVFLLLYVSMYRAELAAERGEAAAQVNRLFQSSLENAMLKKDLEGLRQIVDRLGSQTAIRSAFITNPAGEIRFASDPDLLGTTQGPVDYDMGSTTEFIADSSGRQVLRSINPVLNKEPCTECHGPIASNPLNGVLYVDYDAAPILDKARRTTLLLMSAGALIVLINLAGGWWFIRRFVLTPVARLGTVSQALTAGDFSTRAGMAGRDELSQLGATFDHMANELQRKMRELEDQRTFLQAMVDAIPDGIRVIDGDYRIRLTNLAYRQQLGKQEKTDVGEFCYRSSHGRDEPCPASLVTCPLAELAASDQPLKILDRHQTQAGASVDVEVYAASMQTDTTDGEQPLIVESIRDLSKQVKYSQEQKLSELGRLAAGVAHEIHNPLGSVRLALHAAQQELQAPEVNIGEVSENLELLDREVDKCLEVTQHLLKLSVPPPSTNELVDVCNVLSDTLDLLTWDAETQHITTDLACPPGLRVLATDSELRMLVLNMAQNAFHAMPGGGTLSVVAEADADSVIIRFQDTGAGISPQDLQRIFDPFFSRRADGQHGTGLGLSICRTIVDNYGGRIDVDSVPDSGTTFHIRFPSPEASRELSS